jgi:hypothetical protein
MFPLYSPAGYPMTTESPLDHPHHNSMWMAMDRVRWALPFAKNDVEEAIYNFSVNETFQGRAPGRVETIKTTWSMPEDDRFEVRQELAWRGPKEWGAEHGRTVLHEIRTWTILPGEQAHTIDVSSRLSATQWNVMLGPTRHAYFGLRLAESLRVTEGGWLYDANGNEGGAAISGTRSAWVAAGGNAGWGQKAGVMIFPHPSSVGHSWFVTDWGTLTLNPFWDQGIALPIGSNYETAMRLVIHDRYAQPDEVAKQYERFLKLSIRQTERKAGSE